METVVVVSSLASSAMAQRIVGGVWPFVRQRQIKTAKISESFSASHFEDQSATIETPKSQSDE
jgi:hypothetical protein